MSREFSPHIRMINVSKSLLPARVGREVHVGYEKGIVVRIFPGLVEGSKFADVCLSRFGPIDQVKIYVSIQI